LAGVFLAGVFLVFWQRVEVSGRYSNPPPHPVDLGELPVADGKNRVRRAEIRPARQRQRRLRPADVERLRVDYLAGVRVADLAECLGIARQTVFEHVRRLGLPHRYLKLSPEETAKAVGLYEAGNSLPVVGAVLDMVPGTIRRALARVGVSIRDPQRRDR
jgi:hypothetical protein